jgi:hypothetical protein
LNEDKTNEDVFPRWLKKMYGLSTSSITLATGENLSYNHLKIPCCAKCNNKWLSRIENIIFRAVKGGYDDFIKLDGFTLYLWLAKIYYGLYFKHLNTFLDIRDRSKGYLITPEDIKNLVEIHRILQGVIGRTRITKFPGSIFIYKSQVPKNMSEQFDFADGIAPFISLRMGSVSVTASLLDFGALHFEPNVIAKDKLAKQLELHPIQHTEVTTLYMYTTHLFNGSPTYLIDKQNKVDVITPLLMRMSRKPFFDEFITEDFVNELANKLGKPFEDIFIDDNHYKSTLIDDKGSPSFIKINY